MTQIKSAAGKCLCGAVAIKIEAPTNKVGACHCTTCRNWGGGPLFALDCGTAVTFEGQDNITVFDSSDWAERGFCRTCGTHLFYRLKENRQHFMPVGLFVADQDFDFDHQVFIDEKPAWYSFANDTKNMTGEQVFAEFTDS